MKKQKCKFQGIYGKKCKLISTWPSAKHSIISEFILFYLLKINYDSTSSSNKQISMSNLESRLTVVVRMLF